MREISLRSWDYAEEYFISVCEGNFMSACLQQLVHLKKKKKSRMASFFRSAFGRMISPKQIMVCLCHLFQGKLFRCKHRLVQSATGFLLSYLQLHKLYSLTCQSNVCLSLASCCLTENKVVCGCLLSRAVVYTEVIFITIFYHGAHLTTWIKNALCVLLTSDPTKCSQQSSLKVKSGVQCKAVYMVSCEVKADMKLTPLSSTSQFQKAHIPQGIFQKIS